MEIPPLSFEISCVQVTLGPSMRTSESDVLAVPWYFWGELTEYTSWDPIPEDGDRQRYHNQVTVTLLHEWARGIGSDDGEALRAALAAKQASAWTAEDLGALSTYRVYIPRTSRANVNLLRCPALKEFMLTYTKLRFMDECHLYGPLHDEMETTLHSLHAFLRLTSQEMLDCVHVLSMFGFDVPKVIDFCYHVLCDKTTEKFRSMYRASKALIMLKPRLDLMDGAKTCCLGIVFQDPFDRYNKYILILSDDKVTIYVTRNPRALGIFVSSLVGSAVLATQDMPALAAGVFWSGAIAAVAGNTMILDDNNVRHDAVASLETVANSLGIDAIISKFARDAGRQEDVVLDCSRGLLRDKATRNPLMSIEGGDKMKLAMEIGEAFMATLWCSRLRNEMNEFVKLLLQDDKRSQRRPWLSWIGL